eukprot:g6085.t1
MPQKVNVMTQKVVFGNPTNELLLRAQKLVGPDETILGVVRNSKKNCRNNCYQQGGCFCVTPCLWPFYAGAGLAFCGACCFLDKYLVFQSEIFVFTDQKIYIDIGNKGTRCLAQADWTSPEDGLCGKARPPVGILEYSEIRNIVTDNPPKQTIFANCFPQNAACLYINNARLSTHSGETKNRNMRPIWVDDPEALNEFIMKTVEEVTETGNPSEIEMTRGHEDDPYKALKKLKELLNDGIITQEEFDSKKADIMSRM